MTLIEVLVTMAVMGILFAMIGGILSSFLTNEKKARINLTRERVGSAILEVITRDLQGVYAYAIPGAFRGTSGTESGGDADRLEFLTTRQPAAQVDEEELFEDEQEDKEALAGLPEPFQLTKVGYVVKDSQSYPGFLTLFRYEEEYVPEPLDPDDTTSESSSPFDQEGEPIYFEIYNRVKSFNVRHLDGEGTWQEAWDDEERVPVAVEVTIELEPLEAAQRTGYESAFEETRKGVYRTVIGLPIQLPEPVE